MEYGPPGMRTQVWLGKRKKIGSFQWAWNGNDTDTTQLHKTTQH